MIQAPVPAQVIDKGNYVHPVNFRTYPAGRPINTCTIKVLRRPVQCANARGNRMKLLLHDGFGMWCAARRLNQGGFEWPRGGANMATSITLTKQQFDALVLGLPWSRLEQMQSITRL